jgi:nickel/cobalt transporter (NiCoT) family protein
VAAPRLVRRGDRPDARGRWALFLEYAHRYPPLAGAGLTAYVFGLRHAFDADHIAAIDNTTRKLLSRGRRPMGVGFFFSLGHASVVFGLVAALSLATRAADTHIPAFQHYGGYVSAGVSGTFLWIIGILNLVVLLDCTRIFREMRGGDYDRERLENRLLERGMMSRVFGRFFRLIDASWKIYPSASCSASGSTPRPRSACSRSRPASPRTRAHCWASSRCRCCSPRGWA